MFDDYLEEDGNMNHKAIIIKRHWALLSVSSRLVPCSPMEKQIQYESPATHLERVLVETS